MHYFAEFPRAVQLHVLKYLELSEQAQFACVAAVCKLLSADVMRLLERITVTDASMDGISVLVVEGRFSKLVSHWMIYLTAQIS